MIDPGPSLRALVVAALVGGEVACALGAARGEDGAWGLARPERRATYVLRLARELRTGERVPVADDGAWLARDASGTLRRVRVGDRVREPALTTYGVPVRAPWGRARSLRFLQAALDDLATNVLDDVETERLVLEVEPRPQPGEAARDLPRTTLVGAPFRSGR